MEKRNHIIAFILIGVGLLMLIGKWVGFSTIVALLFILIAIYNIRDGKMKIGYRLLAVGAILLLLGHLMMVVGITLLSLGLFFIKTKRVQPKEGFMQKQNFSSHFNWDQQPWVMRSMSVWHVLGEADLDLSLAIPEDKHTVIMFQGIMGDMDLQIPEYYGVEIEAFVLFGSIEFRGQRDNGMMNRLNWKSSNYETSEQKVKFIVSYLVGDLDINIS
ncbi:cell wall-active antibiotics response protein LiaF [Paenibacillus sp.]|jgi:lia operon protein LiaF|uniref:cell wall-active antibiotics response protein LiaF n=1 Tax=Paenibacillus sp. TaxID=58172 RepID=UPI00282AAE1C|nr:cell wall-active antibiotics response protein LiaF [Paenibacillus sp.]MDR0266933.1 cell wall-active antibiotics response protein LiaF [Paenibacillus sp.]